MLASFQAEGVCRVTQMLAPDSARFVCVHQRRASDTYRLVCLATNQLHGPGQLTLFWLVPTSSA